MKIRCGAASTASGRCVVRQATFPVLSCTFLGPGHARCCVSRRKLMSSPQYQLLITS